MEAGLIEGMIVVTMLLLVAGEAYMALKAFKDNTQT